MLNVNAHKCTSVEKLVNRYAMFHKCICIENIVFGVKSDLTPLLIPFNSHFLTEFMNTKGL